MEKLGQHFLINKNKINKIIDALELKPGDTVIEIGSGHGELTKQLTTYNLQLKKLKIIAVEKDEELAKNLEFRIQNLGLKNIKIIKGDILKILPQIPKSYILNSKSYKIVGNIPYYITGYLLRTISELENKPSLIILTIQKEVAERICAVPPRMNLLAASVQFWAEPEIIDYISKKDFQPAPEVDSAIIKLNVRKSDFRKLSPSIFGKSDFHERYYRLIKILFKQPRKTILNNLRPTTNDLRLFNIRSSDLRKLLKEIGINPNARPQDLSIEQIEALSLIVI